MGLRAHIYKHEGRDFSNGGISEHADEVTITNIDGPFEPSDDAPAVLLVSGNLPRTAKIVPVGAPEGVVGPMAGGTYVSTSDSRFAEAVQGYTGSYQNVVALHDRYESPELYRLMSL